MSEDQQPPRMLLNTAQLQELDALLAPSHPEDDEAINLFILLGYTTAQAISPQADSSPAWLSELLEEPKPPARLQELAELAYQQAALGFYQGAGIELPFPNEWQEETEEAIADWCAGFLQAVFEQEAFGLDQQEQPLAELLLPIMALSGLFAEEDDFAEIEEDPALLQAFAQQLPELLLDIYCQLNAPEEKAKPQGQTQQRKPKNRRR